MSTPARPSYFQSVVCTFGLLTLLVITAPLSFLISTLIRLSTFRSTSVEHARRQRNETVLITGARTTKSLVLARIFWKAGYRVILADERKWGWLAASRFSRCISNYYHLPDPLNDHLAYERKIRNIVKKEKVKLWIPGSSAGATVNDARVAETIRQKEGIKVFIQSAKEIEQLHNKDLFGALCQQLGFIVPESILIQTVDEAVAFLHAQIDRKKEYIVKTTALDDKGRSDLTRLPFSTEAKTRAHLERLPQKITPFSPYVLQQYISGYEFCTHCHAIDGVMQSFLTSPSSDMLMRYMDCRSAFSYRIAEEAEQWTRNFLEKWKKQLDSKKENYNLTGHFSFDFIVDKDGTLYPIECNPRIHTAIVLLSDLESDSIAESYFGRGKNSLLKPPASSRRRYSWIIHALPLVLATSVLPKYLQRKLHPLLCTPTEPDPMASHIPPVTVSPPTQASLSEVIMSYLIGDESDPMLDWDDPMPFAAQHIQWIWLLTRLVFFEGKGWSRVNVSTSRLFSC